MIHYIIPVSSRPGEPVAEASIAHRKRRARLIPPSLPLLAFDLDSAPFRSSNERSSHHATGRCTLVAPPGSGRSADVPCHKALRPAIQRLAPFSIPFYT